MFVFYASAIPHVISRGQPVGFTADIHSAIWTREQSQKSRRYIYVSRSARANGYPRFAFRFFFQLPVPQVTYSVRFDSDSSAILPRKERTIARAETGGGGIEENCVFYDPLRRRLKLSLTEMGAADEPRPGETSPGRRSI